MLDVLDLPLLGIEGCLAAEEPGGDPPILVRRRGLVEETEGGEALADGVLDLDLPSTAEAEDVGHQAVDLLGVLLLPLFNVGEDFLLIEEQGHEGLADLAVLRHILAVLDEAVGVVEQL